MSCFLYILKSKISDIYYTGQSENPPKRLSFHNSIEKGFTARYRPWRVAFQLLLQLSHFLSEDV